MNKKGFLASAVTDMFAFIIFILVVIIAIVIFQISADTAENKLKSDVLDTSIYTNITNFLRTPIEMDVDGDSLDENVTMADFIVYSDIRKDLRDSLETNISKFFNKQYMILMLCFFNRVIIGEFPLLCQLKHYITRRTLIGMEAMGNGDQGMGIK